MFSPFGQWMILVWGCAFLAAGVTDAKAPVWAVFVLEKASYVPIVVKHWVWLFDPWVSTRAFFSTKRTGEEVASSKQGGI